MTKRLAPRPCLYCEDRPRLPGSSRYCEECRLNRSCILDYCDEPAYIRIIDEKVKNNSEYCELHTFRRWSKDPEWDRPAERIKRRSGEGTIDAEGYLKITVDGKKVGEHRVVMEEVLGRPLTPEETVHHKNGDKLNNEPSNLELWASRHPKGQRVDDLVEFAIEILSTYKPEELHSYHKES